MFPNRRRDDMPEPRLDIPLVGLCQKQVYSNKAMTILELKANMRRDAAIR